MAIRFVAIRERDETSIAGAIAIPGDNPISPGGQCVALGRLGSNLYLPIDAELFPSITKDEFADRFVDEYLYVWLPGRGLTAAEPGDVLRVADLIQLPNNNHQEWNQAVPGVAFPQQLVAILPDSPPSTEDIIDRGREDIGQRADEIKNLPKAPNEPLSGVTGAAARAAMVGAAMPALAVGKLLSAIGRIASSATPNRPGNAHPSGVGSAGTGGFFSGLDGIAGFANNLLKRAAQSLEARRHKEIGRLLHMLDSDPDNGLKFAIPFGGGAAHRGLATPSGSLGMRNVNFSLGNLGGGGPADFWDMSPEHQQQLLAKYRELAAREARLGRHRRAAYIYAELLGDMRSAASTLEQGNHFREAAVLYKEKLSNAVAAAGCLERGELWNEAIEAYRDLNRHEKVGDLLTHIQQHEAAAEAYHEAANELLDKQDRLGAARIYVDKLADVRQAVDTLDAGWPDTSQAKSCIAASFATRGRMGWHDEAQEQLARLATDAERLGRHAEVAAMLADAFEKYPDAEVQRASGRLARTLIVNRMKHALESEADRLTSVLGRLAPEDRLLRRDGRRFVEILRGDQQPTPSSASNLIKNQLRQVRHIQVLPQCELRAAVLAGESIVVAGVTEGRIELAGFDFNGRIQRHWSPWPNISIDSHAQLVLHNNQSHLHICAIGEQPLPVMKVSFRESPERTTIPVGTPNGLGVVWGAAHGKTGHTWAIEDRDDPVLVCIDSSGAVVSTQSLLGSVDAPWDDVRIPVPIHVVDDQVIVGVGNQLIRFRNSQVELLHELPRRVTSIVGGGPYAAPIFAAAMESDIALCRLGGTGYLKILAHELSQPSLLLSPGGFLVAADEHTVIAQELTPTASKPRFVETRHHLGKPIAILPADTSDRFVVVAESGVAAIFEIKI